MAKHPACGANLRSPRCATANGLVTRWRSKPSRQALAPFGPRRSKTRGPPRACASAASTPMRFVVRQHDREFQRRAHAAPPDRRERAVCSAVLPVERRSKNSTRSIRRYRAKRPTFTKRGPWSGNRRQVSEVRRDTPSNLAAAIVSNDSRSRSESAAANAERFGLVCTRPPFREAAGQWCTSTPPQWYGK